MSDFDELLSFFPFLEEAERNKRDMRRGEVSRCNRSREAVRKDREFLCTLCSELLTGM